MPFARRFSYAMSNGGYRKPTYAFSKLRSPALARVRSFGRSKFRPYRRGFNARRSGPGFRRKFAGRPSIPSARRGVSAGVSGLSGQQQAVVTVHSEKVSSSVHRFGGS